ncbi:MAG: hypothetical protein AB1941_28160 [Gemmatimonadota bacterium]
MKHAKRLYLRGAFGLAVAGVLGFGTTQAFAGTAARTPFQACRIDWDCFHSSQCGSNGGICNQMDGYCDCFPENEPVIP